MHQQNNSMASPDSFGLQVGHQPEFEADTPVDEDLWTHDADLLSSAFAYALTKVGLLTDKPALQRQWPIHLVVVSVDSFTADVLRAFRLRTVRGP